MDQVHEKWALYEIDHKWMPQKTFWWYVNLGSGAIRQQAITLGANVDPDLCHHIVSLSHDRLKYNV